MEGVAGWKESLKTSKGWAIPAAARHRFKTAHVWKIMISKICLA